MIQHLELIKTDHRTLTITSYPLDKRKVLHQQKVTLPLKLDLNDPKNVFNSKVSLALNDAFIPISVIANSFGTGNYIKMKIIDQIKSGGIKKLPGAIAVTNALVIEEERVLEKSAAIIEEQMQNDSIVDSGTNLLIQYIFKCTNAT